MNILGWIVFAFINIIILFSIDYDPRTTGKIHGFILGITGALSGSIFAYLIVKGVTTEFVYTFYLILAVEAILLTLLFFSKSLSKLKL